MASENHINLQYSEEQIRLTVLTNICRMLVTRGLMSPSKYAYSNKEDEKKHDTDKGVRSITVEHPTGKDHINNVLFLPFIGARADNNVYVIPLDAPQRDQAKAEAKIDFDGSVVIIKIIPQIVKDVSNSPILNDFFKSYNKNHKIIVFDGMSDKVFSVLSKKKNVESFGRDFFMMDMMSHVNAPKKVEFVTLADIPHITNPKLAKMHENDPTCMYFNGKQGQILRIISPSINNCVFVGYRKVVAPKPGAFK
jgi:DNA-directed RNA polymerase subunit H (RpoH/RPB5)